MPTVKDYWDIFVSYLDKLYSFYFEENSYTLELFSAPTDILLNFSFYYPLLMAYLWIFGALVYYFRWERNSTYGPHEVPLLPEYPPVSILIPCHNEAENLVETIEHAVNQNYPDFEVIAINDGSTDDTLKMLKSLSEKHPRLRVINFEKNQGKAMGLRAGALFSKNEFLVCIDGDALLSPEATPWFISHFLESSRVGAVTGNPRIRTRSTLLGKIQVGEFSAIIGLIKRAQRVYGRVFTISGVACAFRKSALQRVGYWNENMITEDIDISWRLQLDHWDIRFEPHAMCWILMPETLRGLWSQRLRWAQGGSEVLIHYFSEMSVWKSRRMWVVYLEYILSVLWAYTMMAILVLCLLGLFFELPAGLDIPRIIPSWGGMLIGTTCLLQFMVSLFIDSRYEKGIGKIYYWMVWYPLVYWIISVATTFFGLIKAATKKKGTRAVWVSPDRGLR